MSIDRQMDKDMVHICNGAPLSHSREDIQMAKRHRKSCSTLPIIREMQIETTMRQHLLLVRTAIIKKAANSKCWRGCAEKSLLQCWWECKLVHPLWRTVWRLLRRLKIELPYDPAIPLLGIYPDKTIIRNGTCTPVSTAAVFTIAKMWKHPRCPSINEWIKTTWHKYVMENSQPQMK